MKYFKRTLAFHYIHTSQYLLLTTGIPKVSSSPWPIWQKDTFGHVKCILAWTFACRNYEESLNLVKHISNYSSLTRVGKRIYIWIFIERYKKRYKCPTITKCTKWHLILRTIGFFSPCLGGGKKIGGQIDFEMIYFNLKCLLTK